jgi:hypothetical protein
MGDEKWTHREPGSISGSLVPPPAAPGDRAPSRTPLPRRKPRSERRAAQTADAESDSPAATSPGQPSAGGRASNVFDPQGGHSSGAGQSAGVGQRRLHLAEEQAIASTPQVPDNVRYLFKPVLNQPGGTAESPGGGRRKTAAFQQTAAAPAPDPAPVQALDPAPAPAADPVTTPASGRDAHVTKSQLRRHLGWAAAVFLIVVTAVSTAFALVSHGTSTSQVQQSSAGSRPGQSGGRTAATGAKALGGLSSAGITRARAARWIVREISPSAIIACDDVMCNQLIDEGLPASNVLVLGPSASDPLGPDIVVATPVLRSQFGSRLALVYAPSVLASFGRGPARIDIRFVAPDGAAAYRAAFSQDLEDRQHYGDILLGNSKITVSPEAKPDVVSGLVDPRLLSMLPVLATAHPIQILGFFDRAPGAGTGIPLSGVELAGSDSSSGMSAASYEGWLLTFLRGQRAPYLAASITKAVVHGRNVVFVRFSYPSPIGLLSGQ